MRGRIVVAAVAAGAFAAAGQSIAVGEGDQGENDDFTALPTGDAAASFGEAASDDSHQGMGGANANVLAVAHEAEANNEVEKLYKSERIAEQRAEAEAERIAAAKEAARPKFVSPAEGSFTSGYGGRWGTTHYGIDIANSIGTPIRSAADGQVIEAGSASGFGQWIRVQHTDGTVTVYGHIDTIDVYEGQSVQAGDQIATMGNQGFSTGPHLHFEVWDAGGMKINPIPWMNEHGIPVG